MKAIFLYGYDPGLFKYFHHSHSVIFLCVWFVLLISNSLSSFTRKSYFFQVFIPVSVPANRFHRQVQCFHSFFIKLRAYLAAILLLYLYFS
jgi:hypothetical protein